MKDNNNNHNRSVLVQVYYGTAGNNGLHIDLTTKAVESLECKKVAYVNYYYLFSTEGCKRVFFRCSEKMNRGKIRRYIKYPEMCKDFFIVYRSIQALAKQFDTCYVIYALTECYKPVLSFVRGISKIKNVHLGILVHDIIPFKTHYSPLIYCEQNEILEQADFYIAHNNRTTQELNKRYNMKKCYQYRFPLLDLKRVENGTGKVLQNGVSRDKVVFLFIGYLRVEKGIEVLLNAWKKVEANNLPARLIIAGKVPENVHYDFAGFNHLIQVDRYLSEEEYRRFIEECDYAVLPYTEGTNSGVLSTVSSCQKPSVVSDITMFKESEFCINELMFANGDVYDLYKMLKKLIDNYQKDYQDYVNQIRDRVSQYQAEFMKEALNTYSLICKA